ncbi:MAG TPA: LamG domain-containing protein [Kofleriaceae bacterium]
MDLAAGPVVLLALLAACGRVSFDAVSGDGGTHGDDADGDAKPLGPDDYTARFPFDTLEVTNMRYPDESGTRFARCPDPLKCGTIGAGVFLGAAYFDGNTELRITSEAAFETPSAYTISVWVKIAPDLVNACLVSKLVGAADGNSWQLCETAPDQYLAYASTTGLTNDHLLSTNGSFDVWHHVALRWDGSVVRVTVDGSSDMDSGDASTAVAFDGQDIVLGFDVDGGVSANYFTGYLDELRVYNRALSDADVAQLATLP